MKYCNILFYRYGGGDTGCPHITIYFTVNKKMKPQGGLVKHLKNIIMVIKKLESCQKFSVADPGTSGWSDPDPGISGWSDPDPGISGRSDPDPFYLMAGSNFSHKLKINAY